MPKFLLRALRIGGFLLTLGVIGWIVYSLLDAPSELQVAYMMVVAAAIMKQVREKGLNVDPISYWTDIYSQSFEWLLLAQAGRYLVEFS